MRTPTEIRYDRGLEDGHRDQLAELLATVETDLLEDSRSVTRWLAERLPAVVAERFRYYCDRAGWTVSIERQGAVYTVRVSDENACRDRTETGIGANEVVRLVACD
jgi:hypothetical protein